MKDIPIPPLKTYNMKLLDKVESVLKRMRWKAFFFLNPSAESRTGKFNLKSRRCPPPIEDLKPFEDDMFKMIENLRFKKVRNSFQDKLKRDVKKITSSDKVLVFADKSRNVYELEKPEYEKLLRGNITKSYRKSDEQSVSNVNQELNDITAKLEIGDRIELLSTARRQAFISLKDHKKNFQNNPKCRLLNPAKNNLGLISKQVLDRVNNSIRSQTNANQRRNTRTVIDWFSDIEDKSQHTFLIFDIVDFYPSISEALLKLSLDYARQFTTISDEDIEIIMHSRKTLLFSNNEPWVKRGNSPMFDVAMGSYDGAEVCELVGLYILHKLTSAYPNLNIGLYRDDGLAVVKNMSARSLDKMRKDFSKIIGELGLQITAQSNLKIVNYLDVTLNLSTGKFCPYRKSDNYPLYINAKSNHPPSIIKRLPATISTRISSLSCDADEFNKASRVYNDALKTSGYRECLQYARNNNQTSHRRRNRPRNIIWFNPPYSENVQTNIASSFLRLIDKHFPKSHVLHKIFNRSNVKVSYSCTGNMSSIIKSHNAKILANSDTRAESKSCNCRNKDLCPLDGACLVNNIVYKATVTTTSGETKVFIGMAEHSFKTRYNNHKLSFKHRKHSHDTVLSKYIWDQRGKNTDFSIKWSIVTRASSYRGNPSRCNLCLTEKLCILSADRTLLN